MDGVDLYSRHPLVRRSASLAFVPGEVGPQLFEDLSHLLELLGQRTTWLCRRRCGLSLGLDGPGMAAELLFLPPEEPGAMLSQ